MHYHALIADATGNSGNTWTSTTPAWWPTASPATSTFALRNGITSRRQFVFWTDAYELGAIGPCTRHQATSASPGDRLRRASNTGALRHTPKLFYVTRRFGLLCMRNL